MNPIIQIQAYDGVDVDNLENEEHEILKKYDIWVVGCDSCKEVVSQFFLI